MLKNDEVDIVAPAFKAVSINSDAAWKFSTTNMIYFFNAIMTNDSRTDLCYNDFEKISTIKIAVSQILLSNTNVAKYFDDKKIAPNLVVYPTAEECKKALKCGEVDAIASSIMDYEQGYKTIAHFGSSDGFVTMPNHPQEELSIISEAIFTVRIVNPQLNVALYKKYYPERSIIPFTKEEIDFIKSNNVLRVAMYTISTPMVSLAAKTASFEEILVEIMDLINAESGLVFEYVPAKSGLPAVSMLKDANIDLVLPSIPKEYCQGDGPSHTSDNLLDCKIGLVALVDKDLNSCDNFIAGIPTQHKNLATILQKEFSSIFISFFDNDEECLGALNSGKIDAIAQNSIILNRFLRDTHYDHVRAIPSLFLPTSYCVAVSDNVNPVVISIINKSLKTISDDNISSIVDQYTFEEDNRLPFTEYIYKNRSIVASSIILVLVLLLLLLWYTKQRIKMYKQLEKSNIELAVANNAKNDFLSSMSHEMRTPMNAIISMSALVADTPDLGISEAFINRLFLPFEQEYGGTTTAYSGTGLDLAVVKNLVTIMNGDISVESKKNHGAKFTVRLPFEIAGETYASDIAQARLDFDFTGKRILLCEDHPTNVAVATKLLTNNGFEVDCAENGKSAVEMLSHCKNGYYDAVLMDIRMPVMDGIEATIKIRALDNSYTKTVPIIAMSANAFETDVEKSREAGMNAYITKPIIPSFLYSTLNNFIK